jgi:hypothetical protein
MYRLPCIFCSLITLATPRQDWTGSNPNRREVEVVASLSQGRTAAAQCGLFTHKSVPVIFESPCITHYTLIPLGRVAIWKLIVAQMIKKFHLLADVHAVPGVKSLASHRGGSGSSSGHVGSVVDKVALGNVFSGYFGFPCQSSFHQILHNHPHLLSGAGSGRSTKWTQSHPTENNNNNWIPGLYCHVQKNMPLNSILSQMNPAYAVIYYLNFILILYF